MNDDVLKVGEVIEAFEVGSVAEREQPEYGVSQRRNPVTVYGIELSPPNPNVLSGVDRRRLH